jgi:hypothetical protein
LILNYEALNKKLCMVPHEWMDNLNIGTVNLDQKCHTFKKNK